MNDGVIGIVFSLVCVSLKEFEVVGSGTYIWGIKYFTNAGWGPWLRGDSALGPPV